MKKILLFISFLVICVGSVLSYKIFSPYYEGSDFYFKVEAGERFSKINYRLHKSKLISNASLFYRYTLLRGSLKKIQSGIYKIPTRASLHDVFEILTSGKTITVSVTIPEGKNLYEIGRILEDASIVTYKEFVKNAKDPSFLKELELPYKTAEGYLFPETYSFSQQMNAREVIKVMVQEFWKKIKKENLTHPFLSPHEVIILASIVEKETGAKFERKIISGVFHNRLKKGIRLQSDPTTIYGIFESFSGNLRKKDLLTKTAYNTYKIGGLPEGPIANPGEESIKAVIRPENHNFLYFVSKNDGTHLFSKSYREHRKGVKIFQKTKKNRQGKSWRDLKQ